MYISGPWKGWYSWKLQLYWCFLSGVPSFVRWRSEDESVVRRWCHLEISEPFLHCIDFSPCVYFNQHFELWIEWNAIWMINPYLERMIMLKMSLIIHIWLFRQFTIQRFKWKSYLIYAEKIWYLWVILDDLSVFRLISGWRLPVGSKVRFVMRVGAVVCRDRPLDNAGLASNYARMYLHTLMHVWMQLHLGLLG